MTWPLQPGVVGGAPAKPIGTATVALAAVFFLLELPSGLGRPSDPNDEWLWPYADGCAHPPAAQEAAVPGPLPAEELERHGLTLAGVQVVSRHGARAALHSPYPCVPPELAAQLVTPACHLQAEVGTTWSSSTASSVPLVKRWHRAFGSGDDQADDCHRGQLLDEAAAQFKALAGALRAGYFRRLPRRPIPERTWLYATNSERTLASADLLGHYLFEDSALGPRSIVQTRTKIEDAWASRAPCSSALAEVTRIKQEKSDSAGFRDFEERWHRRFGLRFHDFCHDPLLVASCTGRLPEDFGTNNSLLAEAVGRHYRKVAAGFLGAKEAYTLLVAPALLELQDFAWRQANGSAASELALWVTHDTTIVPLLVTLGAWDGMWPQYAESLVLEVYRAQTNTGNRPLVRLLRRGRPVDIPSCHPLGPAGLCDLEHLLPDDVSSLRDPAQWARRCSEDAALVVPLAAATIVGPEAAARAAFMADTAAAATNSKHSHGLRRKQASILVCMLFFLCTTTLAFAKAIRSRRPSPMCLAAGDPAPLLQDCRTSW